MGLLERLQTVVVTATLTSAIWIVVGTVYVDRVAGGAVGRGPDASPASATAAENPGNRVSAGGPLVIPVAGVTAAQLVDSFAEARGDRRHEAIDIITPAGTPVVAAAAGTVEKLFRSDAGGNTVYVRSSDRRTIHYYAHLSDYAPGLAEGQQVARGQRLGSVGSSGNADPSAPHLHFAIFRAAPRAQWWEASDAVNPYPLLRHE